MCSTVNSVCCLNVLGAGYQSGKWQIERLMFFTCENDDPLPNFAT